MSLSESRSTIVTHRLPQISEGPLSGAPDDLVGRLEPVLGPRCTAWVGAPAAEAGRPTGGYRRIPVQLPDKEAVTSWRGFAQSALWPVLHNITGQCRFRRDDWEGYLEVNRRYALNMIRADACGAPTWVHDHGLIHTATMLRAVKSELGPMGFFMHPAFPAFDTLRRLPWMTQMMSALLDYDVIGFQTGDDLHNFLVCADQLGHRVTSAQPTRARLMVAGRTVRATAMPCSSDAASLAEFARRAEVIARARRLRRELAPCKILVGVDGCGWTNGVLHKLRAYEAALTRFPSLRGRVILYQVVTPSRTATDAGARHGREIERVVGRISGRFATPGWTPIRYHRRRLGSVELSALYGAADVAMVTPLRSGMSLTAKDFVASRADDSGALILSEACGAVAELGAAALVVNPYDIERMARTIWRAQHLRPAQQARLMNVLRRQIAEHDLGRWAQQLGASLARPDEARRAALAALSADNAAQTRRRLPYNS